MAVWAGACLHPLATCVAKLTWVRSEGFNQGKVVSELKCSLAHGCMTLHVPVPTEYVRPRIGMKRKLGMQSLVYTRFSLWLEGIDAVIVDSVLSIRQGLQAPDEAKHNGTNGTALPNHPPPILAINEGNEGVPAVQVNGHPTAV